MLTQGRGEFRSNVRDVDLNLSSFSRPITDPPVLAGSITRSSNMISGHGPLTTLFSLAKSFQTLSKPLIKHRFRSLYIFQIPLSGLAQ